MPAHSAARESHARCGEGRPCRFSQQDEDRYSVAAELVSGFTSSGKRSCCDELKTENRLTTNDTDQHGENDVPTTKNTKVTKKKKGVGHEKAQKSQRGLCPQPKGFLPRMTLMDTDQSPGLNHEVYEGHEDKAWKETGQPIGQQMISWPGKSATICEICGPIA